MDSGTSFTMYRIVAMLFSLKPRQLMERSPGSWDQMTKVSGWCAAFGCVQTEEGGHDPGDRNGCRPGSGFARLRDGLFHRRPVGSIRGQGIPDVHNREYARGEGDLSPRSERG